MSVHRLHDVENSQTGLGMAGVSTQSQIGTGDDRDGYPALAKWIARDPDNETLIFRRFRRLAARNLLHLQAQLIALEHEIDELDIEARKSADTLESSGRWETLMEYAKVVESAGNVDNSCHPSRTERPEKKRVEKLNDLKMLLREYCRCTITHCENLRDTNCHQMRRCVFKHRLLPCRNRTIGLSSLIETIWPEKLLRESLQTTNPSYMGEQDFS
jgi:hypothetical protein